MYERSNMKDKCNKYEGLFVFNDETALNSHIQDCSDCAQEAKVQQEVSSLLDEVKFYYRAKRKRHINRLRAACAIVFLLFSSISLGGIVITNDDILDTLKYGETLSAEELGFPVDSYGLLMVD